MTVSVASVVLRSRLGVESYKVPFMSSLSTDLENIHQGARDLFNVKGEGSSWHLLLVLRQLPVVPGDDVLLLLISI